MLMESPVAAEPHTLQSQEHFLPATVDDTHATRVREANAFLPKVFTIPKLGWEWLGYLAFCPQIRHRHVGRRLPRYMGAGVLLLRGRMLFINRSDLAPL